MQGRIVSLSKTRNIVVGAAAILGSIAFAKPANAAVILTNFGDTVGGTGDTSGPGGTARVYNGLNTLPITNVALLTSTGAASGVSLTVSNPVGQSYQNGFITFNTNYTITGGVSTGPAVTGTAATLGYTKNAIDGFGYGSVLPFNGTTDQVTNLVFSGLDPTMAYNFDILASRLTGENREGSYTITGGLTGTAPTNFLFNPANNTGTVLQASGFRPDLNNSITISLTAGPNNTNASKIYLVNLVELDSSPVPEPTSLTAIAVAGTALLRRRRAMLAPA